MATFTVFAYGTGENHRITNNIISQFAKACEQPYLYINGSDFLGRIVPHNSHYGAQQIIEWLQTQNQESNTINLAGFSRGSITGIRIANLLKRKRDQLNNAPLLSENESLLQSRLNQLKLHLFALDPVAGLTDKSAFDSRIIPDIVTSFVAILQKDERRRDFKPQDLTRLIIAAPEKTMVSMLPFYGNHSDTIKIKSEEMRSGATLTWYILHQFLTQHGTRFKNNAIPQMAYGDTFNGDHRPTLLQSFQGAEGLLKLFSEHHKHRLAYLQSGKTFRLTDGIPAPRTARTLNQHMRYYVKNSIFFVNQLERELFKIAYPKVFNYLFENNMADPRFPHASRSFTKEQIMQELDKIASNNVLLFKRLKVRQVKKDNGAILLGDPGGYTSLEPCLTLHQLFPSLLPESVKEGASLINQLSLLEREVYRITFQYEREKSEFNFAGKRYKSERTLLIREQVNHIVNNTPLNSKGEENRKAKYKHILNILEKQYQELILSHSGSQLKDMLAQVLAHHGRNYLITQNSVLNGLLINFVHDLLTLIKVTVTFVGYLGYAGGALLYCIGIALESLGQRINEMINEIGFTPLKRSIAIGATLLEGSGFIIKNSLGLKPFTQFVANSITALRDCLVTAINQTTIERLPAKPLAHSFWSKIQEFGSLGNEQSVLHHTP